MNDLIYLALDIILLRKNQLVTSYSRKLLSTDIFEFRLCQIVNLGAMANIHTMDQYLSLLRYFLIITIAKLQNNYQ
jgi:hypothetical protein